ncbi:hypothetical protein [Labedella endophytica]|uniref:Uncharacterized protein n=1 Tax=Labedella endophytica TaxID=1523160 RepID=A0A433JQ23_9MICO|nr:hypothetical protein [Labedella endophytica]RUQ98286.1 hypothetical protein ELQ94_14880 [Labedella endophytica]
MSDTRNGDTGSATNGGAYDRADLRGPAVIVGAIGLAAGVLGTAVVVTHGPVVKKWWSAHVAPAVSSVTRRVLRRNGLPDQAASDSSVILTKSTLRSFSRRVSVAAENARVGATAGRLALDLVELLLAASIIADRMRTRSDDDHEADALVPELSTAMAALSSPPVVDAVNRVLSVEDPALDAETRSIVARVFDGGFVASGGYVPVRSERVESALRITRSAIPVPRSAPGSTEDVRHRP